MFDNKVKRILFIGVLVFMLFLTGCITVSVSDSNENIYSRDAVIKMSSSDYFGYSATEDINVALLYIYNDSKIAAIHGNSFEITAEDIDRCVSEGESLFFRGLHKGTADIVITINECSYNLKLSKSYFGKWIVNECLQVE